MILKNNFSSKDPEITVGIVMPSDNASNLELVLSESDLFELETDNKIYPSCKSLTELSIVIKHDKLHLPELNVSSQVISLIPTIDSHDAHLMIKNVKAGRGFHWEKELNLKYWGKHEFSIVNGSMIVKNILKLEDYLKCVATSEMSQHCPTEFLISQTIVARSWLLASAEKKHLDLKIDACNDDCCQLYQGMSNCTSESIKAADLSYGKVLTYDDEICDARYSKSCGGITESYENVWQGSRIPYLTSVDDNDLNGVDFCNPQFLDNTSISKYIGSVDEDDDYYRWIHQVDQKTLIENLLTRFNLSAKRVKDILPVKKGDSDRIYQLDVIFIDNKNEEQCVTIETEYAIRDFLSNSFLFSSAFSIQRNDTGFSLKGKGWGHGVGLCQIGALGMALKGKSYNDILNHYYPGTKIIEMY